MLEPFGNKRAGCHAFTRQPRGKVLGGNVRLDYIIDGPRDALAHGLGGAWSVMKKGGEAPGRGGDVAVLFQRVTQLEVYRQALAEGLVDGLLKAGAMVVNSNCSVCWGSCQGVIGPGEVLISTGTRNFKGRAGSPDSFVYLGSAATVAASALAGEIAAAR